MTFTWRHALIAVGAVAVVGTAAVLATRSRPRGRRLAGVQPFKSLSAFSERLEEVQESPASTKAAAKRIQDTAEAMIASGEARGGRVFISDIAKRLGSSTARLAPILVIANNRGWLKLSRCDMPGAEDPAKVKASEIDMPGSRPGGGSTVHYITTKAW